MEIDLTEARKLYDSYVEEGLTLNPPYKGFGMKFMQFASEHSEEFNALFFAQPMTIEDFMEKEGHYDDIIAAITESLHLKADQAKWIYVNVLQYFLGLASLIVHKTMSFSEAELARLLGNHTRAHLLSLHTNVDNRTDLIPAKAIQIPGSFASYSNIPLNKISVMGEDNVYFQVDLNSILYFEADGDLVFAYTKKEIFRVKQRLYQLEQMAKGNRFVKASKAFLVNSSKIEAYRTSENGRIYLKMQNGEEILASRMYAKEIISELHA